MDNRNWNECKCPKCGSTEFSIFAMTDKGKHLTTVVCKNCLDETEAELVGTKPI